MKSMLIISVTVMCIAVYVLLRFLYIQYNELEDEPLMGLDVLSCVVPPFLWGLMAYWILTANSKTKSAVPEGRYTRMICTVQADDALAALPVGTMNSVSAVAAVPP